MNSGTLPANQNSRKSLRCPYIGGIRQYRLRHVLLLSLPDPKVFNMIHPLRNTRLLQQLRKVCAGMGAVAALLSANAIAQEPYAPQPRVIPELLDPNFIESAS